MSQQQPDPSMLESIAAWLKEQALPTGRQISGPIRPRGGGSVSDQAQGYASDVQQAQPRVDPLSPIPDWLTNVPSGTATQAPEVPADGVWRGVQLGQTIKVPPGLQNGASYWNAQAERPLFEVTNGNEANVELISGGPDPYESEAAGWAQNWPNNKGRIWLGDDYLDNTDVQRHELGHVLGFKHFGRDNIMGERDRDYGQLDPDTWDGDRQMLQAAGYMGVADQLASPTAQRQGDGRQPETWHSIDWRNPTAMAGAEVLSGTDQFQKGTGWSYDPVRGVRAGESANAPAPKENLPGGPLIPSAGKKKSEFGDFFKLLKKAKSGDENTKSKISELAKQLDDEELSASGGAVPVT